MKHEEKIINFEKHEGVGFYHLPVYNIYTQFSKTINSSSSMLIIPSFEVQNMKISPKWSVHVFVILIVVLLCTSVNSQLQVGFYRNSCSSAELIVKDEVRKSVLKDKGVAAGLVRMHFHDCFVRVM